MIVLSKNIQAVDSTSGAAYFRVIFITRPNFNKTLHPVVNPIIVVSTIAHNTVLRDTKGSKEHIWTCERQQFLSADAFGGH